MFMAYNSIKGDDSMYTKEELLDLATKEMIVYKMTNLINNKVYIGQTIRTFNKRYNGAGIGAERVLRYFEINKDNKKNEHLNNALIKYGTNNFKVEILCQCNTIEELNEKEKYYIDLYEARDYKKGYNCEEGGDNKRKSIDWRFNNALSKKEYCEIYTGEIDEDGEYIATKKYNSTPPKETDLQFFEELFQNKKAVNKKEVIDLLYSPVVYIYKNGGKKYYKYYYYNSLRECCFERNIEIKDAFCMAMRNRIDNRHIKTLYPKVPISKQEVVFVEDMNIDGIEFENRGAKKKAKQKTKEKIKANKKEKIKHYRNCPNCGKIIPSGFRLCADCKRIKDENKKKK